MALGIADQVVTTCIASKSGDLLVKLPKAKDFFKESLRVVAEAHSN